MSEHSHAAHPPMRAETPEAFLADRQRFWGSFTHFTLGSVIFIIVLLVLMAVSCCSRRWPSAGGHVHG